MIKSKSILEVKEGWKADLLRVVSTAFLPFMVYYLYLDMEYFSYRESFSLISKPLSYMDYMLSHTSDFGIIAFTVFVSSAAVLFGPILARKRVSLTFDKKINQLSGKLSRTEEDTSLYVSFFQRYKQINKAITEIMEQVVHSTGPLEGQKSLLQAAAGLSEELSKGLCSNIAKETLNVRKMLEQTQNHFTDYIQNHNIRLEITCPDELMVVADSLFMRLIFLNILGLPICSTPTNGMISVIATQENGYAHVEIQDTRYILTREGKNHLKFPHGFLAKDNELRQLCIQNGWGYEFKEQKKGAFSTKVSIPLKDYGAVENNVVNFPTGTFH